MAKSAAAPGPLLPFQQAWLTLRRSRALQVALLLLLALVALIVLAQVDATWRAFGYGVLIAVPLPALLLVVARLRPVWLRRWWNRWTALLLAGLFAWGLLGFLDGASGPLAQVSLGGRAGRGIIGARDALGALRLTGIAVLSIAFWAPRASWLFAKATSLFAHRTSKRSAVASWRGARRTHAFLLPRLHLHGARASSWAWGRTQSAAQRLARRPASNGGPSAEAPPADSAPSAETVAPSMSDGSAQKVEASDIPRERRPRSPKTDVPLQEKLGSGGWRLPSMDILDADAGGSGPPSKADNEVRARAIEQALASYGIETTVVEINPGPAVTQFGLEPGWVRRFKEVKLRDDEGNLMTDKAGAPVVKKEEVARTRVKVDAITSRDKDLALALAAPSIRIEAPIPGKPLVGIEVPNAQPETVTLRAAMESMAFEKLRARSKLAIALGKGSGGQVEVADLGKMPHLLVAGATGSGKSICLRAILVCLLMNAAPTELALLLIDPKRVELVAFNSVPHLACPAVVDVEKVPDVLKWAIHEMEERYKKFAAVGARNLEAYNKSRQVVEPLPFLVIMIDELADLMMAAPYDVEHSITRLAQLGRATGIHLVVATQRPSVDVVTGLIKANFPTRISFAVSSQVDSRTILDSVGAETLLGRGDMLYLPQDAPKPKRVQGVYVGDTEVERLVRAWNSQKGWLGPTRIIGAPMDTAAASAPSSAAPAAPAPRPDDDPLLAKAREVAQQHKRISPSLLQRRLKIGYTKAAHLVELLEEEGYKTSTEDEVF